MARGGLTVMLVEQNAARALEIADRGYVLELGRNRFEGTGRELLDNPDVRRLYLGGENPGAVSEQCIVSCFWAGGGRELMWLGPLLPRYRKYRARAVGGRPWWDHQYRALPGVLGKGIASRTLARPVT